MSDKVQNNSPMLFGHPNGVYVLSSITAWERFSYWGMRGLLVLFLSASVSDHGFGWTAEDTLRFMGFFASAFYLSPAIGGIITDRWLGRRRAIIMGGALLTLGHFCLAGPAAAPYLVQTFSGVPVPSLLNASDVPLGILFPDQSIWSGYSPSLDDSAQLSAIMFAYYAISITFYLGVLLITLGGGLLISAGTAAIGDQYFEQPHKRDAGYTLYYMLICVGSLLSNLIAGTIGETLGWHWGFSAAGFGMLIGFLSLLVFEKYVTWTELQSDNPNETAHSTNTYRTALNKFLLSRACLFLGIMAIFMIYFSIIYEQSAGIIHLTIYEKVDRSIFGFEVPATWFQSLTSFFILFLSPLFIVLWGRLGAIRREPTFAAKFILGLAFLILSLGSFALGLMSGDGSESASLNPHWFVVGFFFLTLAELLFWPVGYALVAKLAPSHLVAAFLGIWFLTDSIAGFIAGFVGAAALNYGALTLTGQLIIGCVIASAVLFFVRRFEARVFQDIPDIEQSPIQSSEGEAPK